MELIDIAIKIAKGCGQILLDGFHNIKEIDEKTGPGDVVTDVDRRSEAYALNTLKELRPNDGMLGEEGSDFEGTTGYKWIIDPLDGTYNFTLGIPMFCVSVAVCKDGEPYIGVIYDPLHDELFKAQKGQGAYLNNKKLSIEIHEKIEESVIYLSWVRGAKNIDSFNEKAKDLFTKVQYIRRTGSAALGLAYIACNRIHAFVEIGVHPWDVAAGILIIEEAGGIAKDRYDNNVDLSNLVVDVVAANKVLYDNIHKELN